MMPTTHDQILKLIADLDRRLKVVEQRQDHTEIVSGLHGISLQLTRMETNMDQALVDLKASLTAYAAKVDAYVAAAEAFKATVDQKVAEAVAKDDADEAVDIGAMKADIDAAAAKVPDAPVAPAP